MLDLHSSHKPNFNRSVTPHGPGLEFSPVPVEDDELLNAIEAQHETWTLEQAPDSNSLADFWSGVQTDLHNDPTWNTFATDEE